MVVGGSQAKRMVPAVAWTTVRAVFAEIFPEVAAMVAVPAETAVARPPLSTVAAAALDEVQVTWVVIPLVVPSE